MQGILFKEDLFSAIIKGRKTQTRRIVPEKEIVESEMHKPEIREFLANGRSRYKKGDVVYLKEPWFVTKDIVTYRYFNSLWHIYPDRYWKNKLFMPARYARYFLKVTAVSVERLHELSYEDAIAEGIDYDNQFLGYCCHCSEEVPHTGGDIICEDGFFNNPKDAFFSLWQTINGRSSYVANPWVFVYTFELISNPEHLLS